MLVGRLFPFGLSFIIVLLDQLTKYIVRFYDNLSDSGLYYSVIDGFFNIIFVRNDGAAWNILSGQRLLLVLISLFVLLFLLFKRNYFFISSTFNNVVYGLLIGGIIGNLIDRIIFGWVTDFIDLQFGSYHYPSFNIADSCICIGAFLYIIGSYKGSSKEDVSDG